MQLAAQIGRSIESTLVGECPDEVLQNIRVERVEPAAGNRMIVTLSVQLPGAALPKEQVLARLEAWRGRILDRLAQDVQRRGLPELSFWVVRDPDASPPPVRDEHGRGVPGDVPPGDDGSGDDDGSWDPPSILDDV